MFVTKNIPGALFKCLSAFALRDIGLTKIESRPLKGRPFEYLFYVDVLASPEETNCANAMRHLEEMTEFLTVMGTYAARRPSDLRIRRQRTPGPQAKPASSGRPTART